jgi:demethylmenaquinone methyltransferase/2-methoxy-6-polyprenyl-1,4-benzoquinol methylase
VRRQSKSADLSTDHLVHSRDPRQIERMFDAIAGRYDLMNRIMTFGQDGHWRTLAVTAAALKSDARVLDVAAGTGDLAIALARSVGPTGEVIGIDISTRMLDLARVKAAGLPTRFQVQDVLQLEPSGDFDAVTIAFGLRNLADRAEGIRRMAGALAPAGRLVVLELTPVTGRLARLIRLYEQQIIPLMGSLIAGRSQAYRYLSQSVEASVNRGEIGRLLADAGLIDVRSKSLALGTVALVWATKPSAPG